MSSERYPVYSDEDIHVMFEDVKGIRALHLDVFNLTPNSVRKMRRIFQRLKLRSRAEGYPFLLAEQESLKFAKLIDPTFAVIGENFKKNIKRNVILWATE
jgi:hypothetical protein